MQEKAAAEVSAAMKRVEELEAEVAQLRTSSRAVMSLFQLPSKEDVLAGACGRSMQGRLGESCILQRAVCRPITEMKVLDALCFAHPVLSVALYNATAVRVLDRYEHFLASHKKPYGMFTSIVQEFNAQ